MKKVLLLFTRHSVQSGQSRPDNLCAVLQETARDATTYEYAYYDDLLHIIDARNARIVLPDGRRIDTFDLVYHRRWITDPASAVSVAIFLRKQGVPFVDSEALHEGSTNKLVQYWRMWERGISCPTTIFTPDTTEHAKWLHKHLRDVVGLPCIIKGSNSQRGEDNYLVHSVDEVLQTIAKQPKTSFLIQQFIPNDCDYRIFVCGEQIGLIIRRTAAPGTYKNNTSQGGAAGIVAQDELPEGARALCIRAAQVFGRQVAGVDLVFDKRDSQKYYIFEVNRAPQIDTATFANEKAAAINAYFMSLMAKNGKLDKKGGPNG